MPTTHPKRTERALPRPRSRPPLEIRIHPKDSLADRPIRAPRPAGHPRGSARTIAQLPLLKNTLHQKLFPAEYSLLPDLRKRPRTTLILRGHIRNGTIDRLSLFLLLPNRPRPHAHPRHNFSIPGTRDRQLAPSDGVYQPGTLSFTIKYQILCKIFRNLREILGHIWDEQPRLQDRQIKKKC